MNRLEKQINLIIKEHSVAKQNDELLRLELEKLVILAQIQGLEAFKS